MHCVTGFPLVKPPLPSPPSPFILLSFLRPSYSGLTWVVPKGVRHWKSEICFLPQDTKPCQFDSGGKATSRRSKRGLQAPLSGAARSTVSGCLGPTGGCELPCKRLCSHLLIMDCSKQSRIPADRRPLKCFPNKGACLGLGWSKPPFRAAQFSLVNWMTSFVPPPTALTGRQIRGVGCLRIPSSSISGSGCGQSYLGIPVGIYIVVAIVALVCFVLPCFRLSLVAFIKGRREGGDTDFSDRYTSPLSFQLTGVEGCAD